MAFPGIGVPTGTGLRLDTAAPTGMPTLPAMCIPCGGGMSTGMGTFTHPPKDVHRVMGGSMPLSGQCRGAGILRGRCRGEYTLCGQCHAIMRGIPRILPANRTAALPTQNAPPTPRTGPGRFP
jgi:hypothetical protein